jgi:hypothetical protein
MGAALAPWRLYGTKSYQNYEKVVLCGQHLQLEIRQARSRGSAVITRRHRWLELGTYIVQPRYHTIEPFLRQLFAS